MSPVLNEAQLRAEWAPKCQHVERAHMVDAWRALDAVMQAWAYSPRAGETYAANCLAGETLVMTPDGDVPISELAGTDATLLTRQPIGHASAPSWVTVPVKSYGEQALMRVVLSRHGVTREVFATSDHRWIVEYQKGGGRPGYSAYESTTGELRPGQRLASCWTRSVARRTVPSPVGIAHGLTTGDGDTGRVGTRLALCGPKNWPLLRYFPADQPHRFEADDEHPDSAKIVVTGLPATWKRPPSMNESASYLYGWLAGYFAADGRITKTGRVCIYSADTDLLEAAEAACRRLGIVTLGIAVARKPHEPISIRGIEVAANRGLYELRIDPRSLSASFFIIPAHAERWTGDGQKRLPSWVVDSVEETDRVEEVFCAVVPGTEAFALSGYLLTGNCRATTGSSSPSLHSFFGKQSWTTWTGVVVQTAVATDFNSSSNPYSTKLVTDMQRGMVDDILAIRTMNGVPVFHWGGYFSSHKDAMHYQFCCSPEDLATGIDWSTVRGHPSHPDSQGDNDMTPEQATQLAETWQRVKNLESVASRDVDTLGPKIAEVLAAVKADPGHGSGSGDVDPAVAAEAIAKALVKRLDD